MSHAEGPFVSGAIQYEAAITNPIQNDIPSDVYKMYSNGCITPGCIECLVIDDHEYCSLCYGDNIGPDDFGNCVACQIDNCLQCNADASDCELCIDGNPPVMDKCTVNNIICTDPNCIYCPNGSNFCTVCDSGYYLHEYCVPCMTIHYDCMACAEGMCTECSAKPLITGSICVACDMLGCQYCRILYNDRNKSIIKQCTSCYEGYILAHDNSLCIRTSETSCAILNCRRCTTVEPIACLECDASYALYQDTCVICTIPNCLECKIEAPQGVTYETCMSCNKGYSKLVRDTQSDTPQVLCVPILENIDQRINPIIFLGFVSVVFVLALLSAGCMFIYRLIEKDDNRRS